MIRRLAKNRFGPIGVDIGSRSVKLVQFCRDHSRLVDAARWDFPGQEHTPSTVEQQADRFVEALCQAREGRGFRGRDAVMCLNDRQLFLQNIRVPKAEREVLDRTVHQEAVGRVPFPIAEADVRYLEAADIRRGDTVLREIILIACHRPVLERSIELVQRAGLRPVAVDVEPVALLRSYASQFRREQDLHLRSLLVHVGHSSTAVVIAQGEEILFVKYIELGGKQFDESAARGLKMELPEAAALRRHNGDRRSDRQDPEIARSVAQALRPVVERLSSELAMCVRYHSVTFRGKPLERLVLGGGEATPQLLEAISKRLGLNGELSDPFRSYEQTSGGTRRGQWDVAAGLALRPLN